MDRNSQTFIKELMKYVQDGGKLGTFNRVASATEVGAVPADKVEQVFNMVWNSPGGLERVAYAMTAPLKELLDYNGIGRKLIKIDPIPQGEIPVYDKDIPEFASVRVAAFGQPPVVEAHLKRILIPTMNLQRNVRVSYEEIQIRRYPVFDRAKERIAISMAIAEDREIFNLLDVAATVGPNTPIASAGPLNRALLAQAFGVIAGRQLQPASVVMHPKKYADIIALNAVELDQVTLRQTTDTGMIGNLLGMQLLVSTKLPDANKVYVTTTPDKLGRLPVRKELQVYIFNNVPLTCYDIVGWELIGFGIHNSYGVVGIVFS